MIVFCVISLPNDRAQANPVEFGTTIKPTPVTDKVTDFVVAPVLKTVSTDSILRLVLSKFYISFSICNFYL